MTTIKRLERDVQKLSRSELEAFREWFRKYDSDQWDCQIEEDARVGKLNSLAEEAVAAHKAGNTKEF